jgi:hypothetical protein
MLNRGVIAAAMTLAVASSAAAQGTATTTSSSQTTQSTTSSASDTETRPATTTFMGDTGLWYVPTGEVLPRKKWSISAYRVNFDDNQGFSDVSNWPLTFAVGLGDRAELFGSWVLVSRIDRDIRPLFLASIPRAGGVVPQHPLFSDTWSGSQLGDLWIGGKVNLTSQWRQQPAAFALRGMIKLPTGKDDDEDAVSSGKADFAFDAIVSKEFNERVEVSGYGGYIVRGSPDAVETTNGFRWGLGFGMPTRKALRLTAEIDGELYSDDSLATKQIMLATDGSFLPVGFVSDVKNPFNFNLGLTWQGQNGFFAGLGWTYRFTVDKRDEYLSQYTNGAGDRMDIVGRIGFHPGVRIYVAPAPPPPRRRRRLARSTSCR